MSKGGRRQKSTGAGRIASLDARIRSLARKLKNGDRSLHALEEVQKAVQDEIEKALTFRSEQTDPHSTQVYGRLRSQKTKALLRLRASAARLMSTAQERVADDLLNTGDFNGAIQHLGEARDALDELTGLKVEFNQPSGSQTEYASVNLVKLQKRDVASVRRLNEEIYRTCIRAVSGSTDIQHVEVLFRAALNVKARILTDLDRKEIESVTTLIGDTANDIFVLLAESGLLRNKGRKGRKCVTEALKAVFYGVVASGVIELLKMLSIRDQSRQAMAEAEMHESCVRQLAKKGLDNNLREVLGERLNYETFYSAIQSFWKSLGYQTDFVDRYVEEELVRIEKRLTALKHSGYDVSFEEAQANDLFASFSRVNWVEYESAFLHCLAQGRHQYLGMLVEEYAAYYRTCVERLLLLATVLESPKKMDKLYQQHMSLVLADGEKMFAAHLLKELEHTNDSADLSEIIELAETLTEEEYGFERDALRSKRDRIIERVAEDLRVKACTNEQPRIS